MDRGAHVCSENCGSFRKNPQTLKIIDRDPLVVGEASRNGGSRQQSIREVGELLFNWGGGLWVLGWALWGKGPKRGGPVSKRGTRFSKST